MKKRAFWLISLCAILLALFFWLSGFGVAQKHARLINELNEAMNSRDLEKQQSLTVEAKQLTHLSDERIVFGCISGVVSLSCLFISHRRNEPAARSVVIVLMSFYLLLQFAAA